MPLSPITKKLTLVEFSKYSNSQLFDHLSNKYIPRPTLRIQNNHKLRSSCHKSRNDNMNKNKTHINRKFVNKAANRQ